MSTLKKANIKNHDMSCLLILKDIEEILKVL